MLHPMTERLMQAAESLRREGQNVEALAVYGERRYRCWLLNRGTDAESQDAILEAVETGKRACVPFDHIFLYADVAHTLERQLRWLAMTPEEREAREAQGRAFGDARNWRYYSGKAHGARAFR